MNIFEIASKQKLRFSSIRGELTTEQLWDLPLQTRSGGFDLDTIAKDVNRSLKGVTDESFVSTKESPAKAKFELQLEILKYIIAVKMKAESDARDRAAKIAQKEKLLNILAEKEDDALKSLSSEELVKRIAQLS